MPRSVLTGLVLITSALGLSCSEPVPPAARGAAYVAFSSVGACAVGAPHNGRIGFATTTEVRDVAIDTVGGAQLFCSISGDSNSYEVKGSMALDSTFIDFNIASISSANDVSNPTTGTLSYRHVETQNTYTTPADKPCQFWIGSAEQKVADTELWIEFTCEEIRNASINSTCAIGPGSTISMSSCEG